MQSFWLDARHGTPSSCLFHAQDTVLKETGKSDQSLTREQNNTDFKKNPNKNKTDIHISSTNLANSTVDYS